MAQRHKGNCLYEVEHAIVVKGDDEPNGDITDLHQPGEQREANPGGNNAGACETMVDRQSPVQGERSYDGHTLVDDEDQKAVVQSVPEHVEDKTDTDGPWEQPLGCTFAKCIVYRPNQQ